jgi:hypothetical protein
MPLIAALAGRLAGLNTSRMVLTRGTVGRGAASAMVRA